MSNDYYSPILGSIDSGSELAEPTHVHVVEKPYSFGDGKWKYRALEITRTSTCFVWVTETYGPRRYSRKLAHFTAASAWSAAIDEQQTRTRRAFERAEAEAKYLATLRDQAREACGEVRP